MPSLKPLPVVAIVGRPNVGKSTLFNRLAGGRRAIVQDTPGVTRDRHYHVIEWGRLRFTLVDTGGIDTADPDPLHQAVSQQSLRTLGEAAVILFMTDARDGITPVDTAIAAALRRARKPVIHLVNKADTPALEAAAMEAFALGFDPVLPMAAEGGRGLDVLYDLLAQQLPPAEEVGDASPADAVLEMVRVAVIGRPNVGKSTLINRLLGEDRLVTSAIAGTTRDAIDSVVHYRGVPYLFIDTAGIRRRGKIEKTVERASVGRAMEAVERAEVCVLMLDGSEAITEQDTKIMGQVLKAGRGTILVINKWDLHKGDEVVKKQFLNQIDRIFAFASHVPVLFMSGLTGYQIPRLFATITTVAAGFRKRIGTGELNRAVEQLVARQNPPLTGGRPVRIYYATQVGAGPPRFVLFTNRPEGIGQPYLRYLENGLRKAFDFTGTPLLISLRHRDRDKRGRQ